MQNNKKIIIFEFVPSADEIWILKKDQKGKEGYLKYNKENGIISLMDSDLKNFNTLSENFLFAQYFSALKIPKIYAKIGA